MTTAPGRGSDLLSLDEPLDEASQPFRVRRGNPHEAHAEPPGLTRAHLAHVHVSLDMDALDPTEAPGVGTPVAGGLTYREAHLLMEILAQEADVQSADVVEVNPILDERNVTAKLAVGLLASLFGKTIL